MSEMTLPTRSTLSLWWCIALAVTAVSGLSSSSSTNGGVSQTTSSSISDLLSIEQYAAQARRAEVERVLMLRDGQPPGPLLEPDFAAIKKKQNTKPSKKKGGGFGGAAVKRWSKLASLAVFQKERLQEDGAIRINAALSLDRCAALRKHVLKEVSDTAAKYQLSLSDDTAANFPVEDYYGIEPGRSCRTDLLLSLLPAAVSDALEELFDAADGKLRYLFESLVTKEAILYELAGVVTSKGSARQCVHPDLPFQSPAPLYVVFLALQDVTTTMGPTTFLLGSNTESARKAYEGALDDLISNSEIREATLQAGDLVVFDARTMHCGTANLGDLDGMAAPARALFNFSFRNPSVTGNLGYKGSSRPVYTAQEIRLGDVLEIVDRRKEDAFINGGKELTPPFAQYGNGLDYMND